MSTHLDGVASILVSRAAITQLSSVARRILEFHFSDTYVMATVRGTVAPFEAIDESYCAYTDLSKPAPERKIRTIGNRLCVRLPRLIKLVRLACAGETSGDIVLTAINLADELLELKDTLSESAFLHTVGYVETKLLRDQKVTRTSIDFRSLSSIEAGLYYLAYHDNTSEALLSAAILVSRHMQPVCLANNEGHKR